MALQPDGGTGQGVLTTAKSFLLQSRDGGGGRNRGALASFDYLMNYGSVGVARVTRKRRPVRGSEPGLYRKDQEMSQTFPPSKGKE